jgi:hypothetical protein
MKTIQAFMTDDGQMFAQEEKAKLHEMFLQKKDIVEDFLNSELNPYKGNAHLTMARQTVINWELWKTQNAK